MAIISGANAIKNKQFNESWCVFQPHTYSRTKNLLDDFAKALINFDNIIVTDTDEEIALLQKLCADVGSKAILSEGWGKGGEGTKELASAVVEIASNPIYAKKIINAPIKIPSNPFGAKGVQFSGLT